MQYQKTLSRPMFFVRVLWTSMFALLLVGITLLGYIQNIRLLSFLGFAVTMYGIITTLHVSMQMLFATLNRRKMRKVKENTLSPGFSPLTGLMSVGYREDNNLLRNHFRSIKAVNYMLTGYVFISDGNEEETDRAMANVFREVFPWGLVLNLPFVLVEATSVQKAWLYDTIMHGKASHICLLQPHRDKRHAMYTAMELLCELTNSTAIVSTDSDTVLDAEAVRELVLPFIDPEVGAVTGDVKVLNPVNWLSTLSAIRYWFAFNLERAAQSYWGVVNCVSGPLGAYRTQVIREVMHDWIEQTFMGEKCTFGDDRHLTNLTLRDGWKVLCTPFASCKTETPTRIARWIRQQIRWNKSFYREMILNYRWACKHPLWLMYDMTYQTIFPTLLMIGIILQISMAVHSRSLVPLLVFVTTIITGGIFRSLYGFVVSKNPKIFFLAFYGLLYVLFLLPARIWALLTLWKNNWGTSARGLQPQSQHASLYQMSDVETLARG